MREDDTLQSSSTALTDGYGQTKWVSEKVLDAARQRGLRTAVIRPAYILGSTRLGVSNTDDFIWRLLSGCVQLGAFPSDIQHRLNAASVDYVAGVVTAVTLSAMQQSSLPFVYHTVPHRDLRWRTLFETVLSLGYQLQPLEYEAWRLRMQAALDAQPSSSSQQSAYNALLPISHLLLHDLPDFCNSATLDDANTKQLLSTAAEQLNFTNSNAASATLEMNVAYLVRVAFLVAPTSTDGTSLPSLPKELDDAAPADALSRSHAVGIAA